MFCNFIFSNNLEAGVVYVLCLKKETEYSYNDSCSLLVLLLLLRVVNTHLIEGVTIKRKTGCPLCKAV